MPAFGNTVLAKSFDPVAPITKFRFVKQVGALGTDNVGDKPQAAAVAAVTDVVCGVSQEAVVTTDIARGKGLPVLMDGISEMEANAASAINPGDQIATDAVGRAIKLGATGAGTVVYGVAMSGTSVTGNRISVRLLNM